MPLFILWDPIQKIYKLKIVRFADEICHFSDKSLFQVEGGVQHTTQINSTYFEGNLELCLALVKLKVLLRKEKKSCNCPLMWRNCTRSTGN
jgi:hypothetical protein